MVKGLSGKLPASTRDLDRASPAACGSPAEPASPPTLPLPPVSMPLSALPEPATGGQDRVTSPPRVPRRFHRGHVTTADSCLGLSLEKGRQEAVRGGRGPVLVCLPFPPHPSIWPHPGLLGWVTVVRDPLGPTPSTPVPGRIPACPVAP